MNTIFLDIDGILATEATYRAVRTELWRRANPGRELPHRRPASVLPPIETIRDAPIETVVGLLDPECCERVVQLQQRIEARVILTSSWRKVYGPEKLRDILGARGLVYESVTPVLGHRGGEIRSEVERLGLAPETVVVLEDEEDVRPYNGRRVQPTFYGPRAGFQGRHLRQALALFGLV